MTQAVIVSTARTPLAKSWKGAFNMTHGATLGGHAVQAAVQRAGIDAAEVEDVIMGCANPEGATGANIARQVALRAGLPITASAPAGCRRSLWLRSAWSPAKGKCSLPAA
jgi:acetyl-CoA C-acetyltransferase